MEVLLSFLAANKVHLNPGKRDWKDEMEFRSLCENLNKIKKGSKKTVKDWKRVSISFNLIVIFIYLVLNVFTSQMQESLLLNSDWHSTTRMNCKFLGGLSKFGN